MSVVRFPHHDYQNDPAQGEFQLIASDNAEPLETSSLPNIGDILRDAGVAEITLIHGTFAGNDAFGILREIARVSPRLAQLTRPVGKRFFDTLAGDVGNYSESFADRLRTLVNENQRSDILVRRFAWSGENHHLGRADGVIAFLQQLQQRDWKRCDRVLVLAHSHGGNLMAMLTRLVGASEETREQFFTVTKPHYRKPLLGTIDLPAWAEIRDTLGQRQLPEIDVVTFGTPLRYRWQRSVAGKLLHFVQHRITEKDEPAKASFPESARELIEARGGDYVQQLGIGGTDFLHSFFALRSWGAERRLREMFESGIRRLDLIGNLQLPQR